MPDQVRLAPLRQDDLPALWAWINDRELVVFNAPYRPVSEAQHRAWFDDVARSRTTVVFGIRTVDGDRLIGTAQLHAIHPVHRSAELQIRIGDAAERGRGLGTAAVEQLLDFGFRDLNLHRIGLHVLADNAAALRVYEKCGFQREGVLREAAHIDGKLVDLVILGLLRSDRAR